MVNNTINQARAAQQAANGGSPQGVLFQLFYVYSAQFTDLDANETETVQVQIQADSDFMLQSIATTLYDSAGALQASGALPSQLITMQLTDVGSGANLFSQTQPIQNVAGSGQLPFILPVSKVMSANSQIGVQVTNTTATANLQVYVSLIGKKLYRAG